MKSTIHESKKNNIKTMSKKLLLSMAVVAMLFTACNGKKTDEHGHDHTDGTHEHADGATHENHADETVSQEEFTVGKDSVTSEEAHGHQHKSGEKHSH
jgi:ABC-type nickel/cobalt efflux system permease component RcnA